MDIGLNIKKIRENRNMTRKELANLVGISEVSIKKYELNERKPKYENLEKLAKALRVPLIKLDNKKSLTYELIYQLYEILNTNIDNIENETGIAKSSIEEILQNPIRNLSINEQRNLLKFFYTLNEAACINFCNIHSFDGDIAQTRLIMEFLYPADKNINNLSATVDSEFNTDLFEDVIKNRIFHTSNYFKVKLKDSDVIDILHQVDNIISFEIYKKANLNQESKSQIKDLSQSNT
jgi:transcriptional regulator with XRE-family HTH domain